MRDKTNSTALNMHMPISIDLILLLRSIGKRECRVGIAYDEGDGFEDLLEGSAKCIL
jgi:hypothetical protein